MVGLYVISNHFSPCLPCLQVADFFVKDNVPGVDFDISRSWAGNILTHPDKSANDYLFYWAFEREEGSLAAKKGERSNEPWAIHVDGLSVCGPGFLYACSQKLADFFIFDRSIDSGMSALLYQVHVSQYNNQPRSY
jgi:hypothetical protein